MFRRNLHRGLVAIVFAAILGVGSASPAAAKGFDVREVWVWLSSFWAGGVTHLQATPEGDGTTQGGSGGTPSGPTTQGDCGPEIDPDGCPRPHTGASGG